MMLLTNFIQKRLYINGVVFSVLCQDFRMNCICLGVPCLIIKRGQLVRLQRVDEFQHFLLLLHAEPPIFT